MIHETTPVLYRAAHFVDPRTVSRTPVPVTYGAGRRVHEVPASG